MSEPVKCEECARRANEMPAGLAFFIGAAGTTLLFALVITNTDGAPDVRREAVKAGHAEWRADPDGKPKFTWKDRP